MLLHFRRIKNILTEHCNKIEQTYAMALVLLVCNVLAALKNLYTSWTLSTFFLFINVLGVSCLLIGLKKQKNTQLTTHALNCLCMIFIALININLNSNVPSLINWFYLIPILATLTLNRSGLFLYGTLAGGMMLLCLITVNPVEGVISFSTCSNSLLVYTGIYILLYALLVENKRHETKLKKQNIRLNADKEKFHYLSHHDSLTNLPNRSYFLEHLDLLLQKSIAEQQVLTLYFMDLNGFKKINDQYGHEIGDTLLLEVGKRLRSCFREDDFIARLAGDEFTALITHQAQDNLPNLLITRINKEFLQPFLIKNTRLNCSISIGIATYPTDAKQAEQLLAMADRSMYRRKKINAFY